MGWAGNGGVGDTKGTGTACRGRDHAGMAGEHLRARARQGGEGMWEENDG